MLELDLVKKNARKPGTAPSIVSKIAPQTRDASPPSLGNDLIAHLSPRSRRLLLDRCDSIRLTARQVLQERGLPLQYAYFIESGAASLTTRVGDCPPVEIHTLGKKTSSASPWCSECGSLRIGALFTFLERRCGSKPKR